jgi:hypothetical protein
VIDNGKQVFLSASEHEQVLAWQANPLNRASLAQPWKGARDVWNLDEMANWRRRWVLFRYHNREVPLFGYELQRLRAELKIQDDANEILTRRVAELEAEIKERKFFGNLERCSCYEFCTDAACPVHGSSAQREAK